MNTATSNPFPVLTVISRLLRYLGWFVAVVGVLYAVITGIVEPVIPGHSFNLGGDGFDILIGIAILIVGICVVAFGESLGVLFAIEANTRK